MNINWLVVSTPLKNPATLYCIWKGKPILPTPQSWNWCVRQVSEFSLLLESSFWHSIISTRLAFLFCMFSLRWSYPAIESLVTFRSFSSSSSTQCTTESTIFFGWKTSNIIQPILSFFRAPLGAQLSANWRRYHDRWWGQWHVHLNRNILSVCWSHLQIWWAAHP